MSTPSRNEPCRCGSGKKYKNCCLGKDQAQRAGGRNDLPRSPKVRNLPTAKPEGGAGPADLLLHYRSLGNSYLAQGKHDAASRSYRRALAIKPDLAEVHCNLGLALQSLGDLDAAVKSYRRALALKPDLAEVHSNLGLVLQAQGNPDAAVASYRRAIAIRPDFADAYYNLGIALKQLGKPDEAVASYRGAISLNPDHAEAYGSLANLLRIQGNPDEALACYRQQLRIRPGNAETQHHIASLTGNSTQSAPAQYVEKLFDDYADTFDAHLVQALKYEAPAKLVELVVQHMAPAAGKWDVLDLGCGTGLVGVAIAPYARQLVGVDLSSRMLEKARARNLYQRLEQLEMLAMARGEQASSFDVIIAAEVFVYLGKLDEIVGEIKRLLRPGGVFAFSVEALAASSNDEAAQGVERDFQLGNTGRYSHSAGYLARLASASGYSIQETAATQLRTSRGNPVDGLLVLWKS
ncbi:MAG: tetratricopeptide repeat protein [Burkholderiales bacterium]|nr:tetratricopeptide repeat protein [Burkholderiales bacterium]